MAHKDDSELELVPLAGSTELFAGMQLFMIQNTFNEPNEEETYELMSGIWSHRMFDLLAALDKRIDPNSEWNNKTALWFAIQEIDDEHPHADVPKTNSLVQVLCESRADPNKQTTAMPDSILNLAVWEGLKGTDFMELVVSTLASYKANLEACREDHWTALRYSVFQGHASIAKVLLTNHADVNARTKQQTPALWFEYYGVDELWYGGETPLFCAAARGHLECVALLLRHKADPMMLDAGSRHWTTVCRWDCKTIFEAMHAGVPSHTKRTFDEVS